MDQSYNGSDRPTMNICSNDIDLIPDVSYCKHSGSTSFLAKGPEFTKSFRKSKENFKLVSPDGGWGWLILLGCFIIHVLLPMLPAFFGLLFTHLIKELQLSSSTVAWVYNTAAFIWNFAGFIVGPLCSEFGWRPVALFGTFLVCLSVFLTDFANCAAFIFISFSVMFGVGGGLAFSVCHLALPHYFDKKRGLAMGITMCGISVGQFILPPFITYLQFMYGYQRASLIFGAFLLNSFVGAALFHPIKWHVQKVPILNSENTEMPIPIHLPSADINSKLFRIKKICINIFNSTLKTLHLLRNPKVLVVSFNIGLVMTGYLNFILMLPFSFVAKGYDIEKAAYGISFLAAFNFVGRLLIPILTEMFKNQYFVCFLQFTGQLIISSSLFMFCLVNDHTFMIICLCFLGFGIGISTGLYTLVLIAVFGLDKLPSTFGAVSLSSGLIYLIFGPISGWLRDYSGSFNAAGQFLSFIILLGASFWILMPLILRCEKRRRNLQNTDESKF